MKRVSENEKKREQNIARAAGGSHHQERKMEIEKTLATTKISTASMGKFDKRLDGEKKIRGVKRKVRLGTDKLPFLFFFFEKNKILLLLQFEPTELSVEQEKNASLSLLAKMDSDHRKMGKEPRADETELSIRKAVRFASRGKAGQALRREVGGKVSKRGRGGRSR